MKLKKLSVIILFCSSIFCSVMMVNSSEAATGWIPYLTINVLYVHGDCYLVDTIDREGSCSIPERFVIRKEHPMAKEMYATALAAMLSGKKIAVYISDPNDCFVEGSVITALGISK